MNTLYVTLIECCENRDWDALKQNASKFSAVINQRQSDILHLIVQLRELLSTTDVQKRSNGMRILSAVLQDLKSDLFTEDEVSCIANFFRSRLNDNALVVENCFSGISSLCQMDNYTFEMAKSLFDIIQKDVPIQLFKPEHKFQLYSFIRQLFHRYQSEFIAMGSNFMYGFLRIIDAETSPTCLEVIFDLFHDVASIEKFAIFKEDIFEAMACYFPIIYNKQKKDKYLEVKLRLSKLLNRAMSATANFAEYVLQLTLEKLESESIGSKLSCYELLCNALPRYEASQVESSVAELWTFIRIDTLKPSTEQDELSIAALATLTALSKLVYSESVVCSKIFDKIWKDLEISIKSPELNLIGPTIKIFLAFSSSHVDIYGQLFERLQPILLQSYLFTPQVQHKLLCLDAIYQLILHGRKMNYSFPSETVTRLFDLLTQLPPVNDKLELRQCSVLILNQLVCLLPGEEAHVIRLVSYFTNFAEQYNYTPSSLYVVYQCIQTASKHWPEVMLSQYVLPLMQQIDASINTESSHLQSKIFFQLNTLRSVVSEKCMFQQVAPFIVSKLTFCIATFQECENQWFVDCSLNLLDTLDNCFTAHNTENEFVLWFEQNCIDTLLTQLIDLCFVHQKVQIPYSIVKRFALIYFQTLSALGPEIKKKTFSTIMNVMVKRDLSTLLVTKNFNQHCPLIVPSSLVASQANLLLSLVYACCCDSNCAGTADDMVDLFNIIKSDSYEYQTENCQNVSDSPVELSAMILSQIILRLEALSQTQTNKLAEETLTQLKSFLLSNDANITKHKAVSLRHLMWISKSLFILKHNLFESYVQLCLELLEQNTFNEQLLQLVDLLYSSCDFHQTILSHEFLIPTENYSTDLQQMLLTRYEQEKNCNLLYLLVSHLRFIPRQQIVCQLDRLLVIVLSGLKTNQRGQLNLICLNFVEDFLRNEYHQMETQVVAVLRSLIELATNAATELLARKKALDCITLIVDRVTEQDLLNLKVEFLRRLRPTLADHKRLVRASAVKAYCKLTMLGQPGNRSKL